MVSMGSNIINATKNVASNVVNRVTNSVNANSLSGSGQINNKDRARAMAYLKEYVRQMRGAGFSDMAIANKLKEIRTVFIPDNLPENFGRTGIWTTGMADEFGRAAAIAGKNTGKSLVPSPNDYLNYMPGYTANRLPNYEEFTGQDISGTYSTNENFPTASYDYANEKFNRTKLQNLRTALQNYSANYKGAKIAPSQYGYEAGIVGLPQDVGQGYYQDFLSLAQQKAEEAKNSEEYNQYYNDLVMTAAKLGIPIEKNDTPETLINKISSASANKTTAQDDKAFVIQEIINKFQTGQFTIQDAYSYAIDQGIVLSMDDILDIYSQFNSKG